MSRARHHTRKHKASGGAAHEYNAVGSPTMKEAHDSTDGFRRGGKAKGKKGAHRADRPKRASGGKVFSAAASTTTRPGGDMTSGPDKEDD